MGSSSAKDAMDGATELGKLSCVGLGTLMRSLSAREPIIGATVLGKAIDTGLDTHLVLASGKSSIAASAKWVAAMSTRKETGVASRAALTLAMEAAMAARRCWIRVT